MAQQHPDIRSLLQQRAELQARLNLLPYDGNPEVKEIHGDRYIYIRKRVAGRQTSTYVDVYSDELYQLLLRNARERRELNRQLRQMNRQLAAAGYKESALPPRVLENLDFARANMKANIYDQAVLEGVATSFPQTEAIIENGIVNGMSAADIQKILNLKHAWEFILDPDVIQSPSNYDMLCHIAGLVNEGFFYNGGRIRSVPVSIGGTSYVPPLPIESVVKESILNITSQDLPPEDIGIDLCLYCMRTQVFVDGNKRASVIFANHWMIRSGMGFLVIPEARVARFKQLLVSYYESADSTEIAAFMKDSCWRNF